MLKVFENILTIPNIELKPEYSLSQEISISKKINNKLSLYGVGFYTRISNAIVKDNFFWNQNPDPNGEPLWAGYAMYDDQLLPTFANQNIEGLLKYLWSDHRLLR